MTLPAIESLRLLASLFIVYYHILHSNIISYVPQNSYYYSLQEKSNWAGILVELFLIIGGYYLYQSEKRKKPFISVFLKRIVRLWPVFAFYTLIMIIFFHLSTDYAFSYLLFLHATGLTKSYTGIIWYISPYFWSYLLIVGISRSFKRETCLLVLALMVYFGYAININSFNGALGRETVLVFLSSGMLRTLAGLSLGFLVGSGVDEFKKRYSIRLNTSLGFVGFSIIELLIIIMIIQKLFMGSGNWSNRLIIIYLYVFLFISFENKLGLISRMCNKKLFGHLGKYSYSIYVMQQVSFYILGKTFWKNSSFLSNHIILSILISILFTAIIGVITYHLIERPANMLFEKIFQEN